LTFFLYRLYRQWCFSWSFINIPNYRYICK
jgi:hypothetical protein